MRWRGQIRQHTLVPVFYALHYGEQKFFWIAFICFLSFFLFRQLPLMHHLVVSLRTWGFRNARLRLSRTLLCRLPRILFRGFFSVLKFLQPSIVGVVFVFVVRSSTGVGFVSGSSFTHCCGCFFCRLGFFVIDTYLVDLDT